MMRPVSSNPGVKGLTITLGVTLVRHCHAADPLPIRVSLKTGFRDGGATPPSSTRNIRVTTRWSSTPESSGLHIARLLSIYIF